MQKFTSHRPGSNGDSHQSWEEAKKRAEEETLRGRHTLAKRLYQDEEGRDCVGSWDPRHPGRETHNRLDASRYWEEKV